MNRLKKTISLKISEYESLFKYSNKEFMGNCKFINGSVSKLLKENTSYEEIIQFIENCIKARKDGISLLIVSKDELLSEYKSLFNTKDEFYGKDFKKQL